MVSVGARSRPAGSSMSRFGVGWLVAFALLALSPSIASAQGRAVIREDAGGVRQLVVTLNKSRTFNVDIPFSQVSVGSSDIADVIPISDRSFYVLGKRQGTTNVTLYDANKRLIAVMDVDVRLDTRSLEQSIRASTGSGAIRVSSTPGRIILSGRPEDSVAADRAVQVAAGLVPTGGAVVNAMGVKSPQQVMLKVRFLEASREGGRELGVNWFAANRSRSTIGNTGLISSGATGPFPGAPGGGGAGVPVIQTLGTLVTGVTSTPFGSLLANVVNSSRGSIDVLISALEEKGVVRRLAEPNLVAQSGEPASFNAGGEYPIPTGSTTSAGVPTITITYKKYGVSLNFLPTVLQRGQINLQINPKVSELDPNNAVTVGGVSVPGILEREAKTTIELRDGQHFAIAGLFQTRSTRLLSQLPWIGSVPILGALFRSTSFQENETDLVIIVTPHLVRPGKPGDAFATPLDERLPGNDVDVFLVGQPEVKRQYQEFVSKGGEVEGPYGHIVSPTLTSTRRK
jgi:pilus assembly protein CpaC